MKKHLGEYMYPCALCSEKFRTQIDARRHAIVHAQVEQVEEEIIAEEI